MTIKAWFIGGPFNGVRTELKYAPPYLILAEKYHYEAIYDPDTGAYLGGYAYTHPDNSLYAMKHDDPEQNPSKKPWWRRPWG